MENFMLTSDGTKERTMASMVKMVVMVFLIVPGMYLLFAVINFFFPVNLLKIIGISPKHFGIGVGIFMVTLTLFFFLLPLIRSKKPETELVFPKLGEKDAET
jgi:hypothetical protein